MVIFHTDHWGALSFFIALSVERHQKDYKVLYYPKYLYNEESKRKIIENLKKLDIFQKIIVVSQDFPNSKSENEDEINKAIIQSFDKDFLENGIHISKKDIFYTATDFQGVFRYYLTKKGFSFIHVMLTESDIYEKNHEFWAYKLGWISQKYMELLNSEHVYDGLNSLCEKIIAYPDTKVTDENKEKIEKYDFSLIAQNIDTDLSDKILSCFIERSELESIKKAKALLLSQSNGYMSTIINGSGYKGNVEQEQMLIYQSLVDYYLPYNVRDIVIKPHPNSNFNWSLFFKGASLINNNMPIELIRLCKEIRIKETISVQTTSIEKLKGLVENNITASSGIITQHRALSFLFTVSEIYNSIMPDCPIEGLGFKTNFFALYMKMFTKCANHPPINSEKYKFSSNIDFFRVFYNPRLEIRAILRTAQVMNQNSVAVLFPVPEDIPLPLYDVSIFANAVVFEVVKEKLRNDTLASIQTEYMWVFSKSIETRDKLKKLSVEKICGATGIRLTSRALSNFEKQMYFENYKSKNELCALKTKVSFSNVINDPVKHLDKVTAFEEYIYRLSRARDLIVFISVKDNAGKVFTYTQLSLTDDLNLKTKWNQIGWNSYIAVIDNNYPQVELLSKGGQPLIYDGSIDALRVHIESHSYDKGNFASITLNDAEYAVNERGFNFVIYDKAQKKIIDRVCFDMFKEKPVCIRKDERA